MPLSYRNLSNSFSSDLSTLCLWSSVPLYLPVTVIKAYSSAGGPSFKGGVFLNLLNKLWNFFSSVKLTVIILLSLAATSIIGTVIPQNESPGAYLHEYGKFLYRTFDFLDIFDMYHSWWFRFLLLLLTTNIIVCSIYRLSAIWKIVFVKNPPFKASRFKNLSNKEEFSDTRSPQQLLEIYQPVVSQSFRYNKIELADNGFCIFAEKWRWTRLGVYTVHLSVILLIIGSLIGSIFGFEGYVNIPEGETKSSVRLKKTDAIHNLDFAIRCDDFTISYYDTGAPSEYRSALTILEQGQPVLQSNIIVNHPLRYKGINIFQASYGELPPQMDHSIAHRPEEITLKFTSRETGLVYQKKAVIGEVIDIPEGKGKFVITEYKKRADFMGQNIGEAYLGIFTPSAGNPVEVLLPLRFPNFDKMRKGNLVVAVVDQNRDQVDSVARPDHYYTGLQVTKDPGVWIVYSGFILIIIGCFITFFMSHQSFFIEVSKKGNKSFVMVAGTANKNKLGMQDRIKSLCSRLTNLK